MKWVVKLMNIITCYACELDWPPVLCLTVMMQGKPTSADAGLNLASKG